MTYRNEFTGDNYGHVVQAGNVDKVEIHPAASAPQALAGLPPPTSMFLGRNEELHLLRTSWASSQSCVVASGLAGVGKTELVLHAAHAAIAAGSFPGGVLFINMQGYDRDRIVGPSRALETFLRALGVRGEHIPPETQQRAALYRSRLAEREPMLIVIDNASSDDQVRHLLPGTSAHRVLITSRHALYSLDDAYHLDIGVLDNTHAAELVGDPDLATLCGNLPLALRIVAALRRFHPEVAWVSELSGDRLELLDDGGSRAVRSAFALSYHTLRQDQRRLFRLLSLHPGDEITEEGAQALADLPAADTRRLLRDLRRAHLVDPGSREGDYRFHDLVRIFAERCLVDDAPDDRDPAITRVLSHFTAKAETTDSDTWLDHRHQTLVAAMALARESDHDELALRLINPLTLYFLNRHRWQEQSIVGALALDSARKVGNETLTKTVLFDLAYAHLQLDQQRAAEALLREARDKSEAAGNAYAELCCLILLGAAYTTHNRFEALRCINRALGIDPGAEQHDRTITANLLTAHRTLGHGEDALAFELAAVQHHRNYHNQSALARALLLLALGYTYIGNHWQARRALGDAVTVLMDEG